MIEVIGLLAAFVGIFILRAKQIDFYIAITFAAIIIGLTSGKPFTILITTFEQTLKDHNTWILVSAVLLITVLGYVLKETGLMIRFIEGLSGALPGNVMMATIPALFGFLSMPGGALMSAPFIEPEANKLGLDQESKTYYNVWFRHLLYWINPITSSTIMAITLSGFDINTWLTVQSPLFLAMVAIGFIASKGFIKTPKKKGGAKSITLDSLKGSVPLVLAVGLTLLGLPIWGSLLIGILVSMFFGHVKAKQSLSMFKNGLRLDLALSIISMLYLRDMIGATGSITSLFGVIIGSGIPVLAIAIIIPLFIGAISGSPAMGIGIAFPILLPLLGEPNIHLTSILFLGITCTYITSPLHLCLVLSNSYFNSDLNKVIKYLLPSSIALYFIGLAYHLLLYSL